MVKTINETINYKRVLLYESKVTRIVFVQNKNDRMMDGISIIRLGTEYNAPKSVNIYRYEDENYINHMLNLYNSIN